jgi:hypothetical protein
MKQIFRLYLVVFILLQGCERPNDPVQNDDGIPPAVPAGLAVYYSADGEVGLEWIHNLEMDVTGYNIYRRTESSGYSRINFTSRDYFFDDSLSYDTVYYYRISAVDNSGLESVLSPEVSAKPENKFNPRVPQRLFINARNWNGERSVFLNWSRTDETDITGYKIYRGTSEGFTADTSAYLAYTTVPEFSDTSAEELYVKYYYSIKAVDKGGLESSLTPEISDMLLENPELLYPAQDFEVHNFRRFVFVGSGAPASYKIVVQSNLFFGEIWQSDISSSEIRDTIYVEVPSGVFYYNTPYYWRVAAYTVSNQPNSISPLYKFIIKQ